ncbi:MAG: TetR/AcrR family transcriptional regulator [Methylovulum miyakonense]|uniref:TetR/AcrR family transcriptional regulator n=1 Tax=Methylovulum miyakonense TaxID=645578 RepID=UPI003BB68F70
MARYKTDHKEQTRERIIAAAGRCFKKGGYSGIGIDGLAKEAGVTSGAFYGHFSSKENAFIEIVVTGLREVHDAVQNLQSEYGTRWLEVFIDFYLSTKRTCDLTEACALQALTPEVTRSNEAVRAIYQAEMIKLVDVIAQGLPQGTSGNVDRAWTLLVMLSGGVTLMRALADEALAAQVAQTIRVAALTLIEGRAA